MSGYNPGRRPGRRTIICDILMIVLALAIVVLTVLVFILREQYNGVIPVIFMLGAAMNGVYAIEAFSRDERRKRNISGAIFALVFCVLLVTAAVVSGVSIWGAK